MHRAHYARSPSLPEPRTLNPEPFLNHLPNRLDVLNAAGVPAVEVVAYGERRTGGLLRGAVCAVLEFPGAMELVPWIFARFGQEGPWTPSQRDEREGLLRRLGGLLRRLHDAGFVHPDLHGGNLLLSREGSPPDLRLELTQSSFILPLGDGSLSIDSRSRDAEEMELLDRLSSLAEERVEPRDQRVRLRHGERPRMHRAPISR